MKKTLLAGLVCAILGLLSSSAAHAQILLTVDVSNPGAVTFTATGNLPSASATGLPMPDGFDLLNFFTFDVAPNFPFLNSGPTTLTTGDGSAGTLFDQFTSDDASDPGGNFYDLNILNNNVSRSVTFSFTATEGDVTGQPAFTGTLTLNLATDPLPAVGASGNIITGYSESSSNTTVGRWEVVSAPEPSTWLLMLGGLGALAFVRRRMTRA